MSDPTKIKCAGHDIKVKVKYLPMPEFDSPGSYHATCKSKPGAPSQCGNKVKATITLDPILKKFPDLKRGVLAHETHEICNWAKGDTAAHTHARAREPEVIKSGGATAFWKEVKRRDPEGYEKARADLMKKARSK